MEKNPIIPNINIYGALWLLSSKHRGEVAINCHEFNATFAYLLEDSVKISQGLNALGIHAGEIIAVCMPNIYQTIAIFFAANRIGITVTFLNECSSCEEICYYLNLFKSPLLINSGQSTRFNQEVIRRSRVKHIITLDESERSLRFLDMPIEHREEFQPILNFKDLYACGYGKKKSAKIFLCGRQTILTPELSFDTISYYMDKKPNIIFGSPALLELIMRGTADGQDLSDITTFISGGDYLTATQESEGKAFFASHGGNVIICNGSGNAETSSCGTNSVGVALRPGSVGRILSGTDAVVIDPESRKELKYGEEGLLCISGKHIFKEYYNEPDMTKKAKWIYKGKTYFMTGMLGILDTDGYFTITGREARFYITSSLNKVYCERVQSVIASIDVVSMCAVVEVPDSKELFLIKHLLSLNLGYNLQKKFWIISKRSVQNQLY